MTYRYEEMSWPQIREAAKSDPVVVLPVGTTEQHGPHLPLMVDYLCAESIGRMAVEKAQPHAILMHPVPYSFNEHHMDFPGTISIDPHTIIDYVSQIGYSVAHHGFRHIVILNGHGSNVPFMDIAARNITNRSEAICAMLSWWSLLTPEDLSWRESPYPGGFSHACEAETSLLLALRPDLVDMSKAENTLDDVQRSENIYWDLQGGSKVLFQEFFSRNTPTGIQGSAKLGTEEKGKLLAEAASNRIASFLLEFRERVIRPRRDLHKEE